MFSYLEPIQNILDPGLYSRGLKLYLEGKIVAKKELTLDFWREYEVIGSHSKIYKVKTPLLHLALSKNSFQDSSKAIQESVLCDCEYFQSFGICKHIVAVFADLENEFNPKVKAKKSKEINFVLDSIFEVEEDKKFRKILNDFEYYVERDLPNTFFAVDKLSKLSSSISKDSTFKKIRVPLSKLVENSVIDYDKEKRIAKLITDNYLASSGGKNWFRFWFNFIPQFERINQILVWTRFWKIHILGITKDFDEELFKALSDLNNEDKEEIRKNLEREFKIDKKFWVDFCFKSKHEEWIQENLGILSPEYLVSSAVLLPEKREEIERELATQIRTWSDFLQTGEYEEFLKVLKRWKNEMGASEYWVQVLDYIKSQHHRKKKLYREILKLES